MSDIGVEALVVISPDFTGFEEKITRALKDAVDKAQKSATINLNVASGGAASDTKAFTASLNEVNKSLKEIAVNTQKASEEIKTGFISQMVSAIQKTALFAGAISQVIGNVSNIIAFGKSLGQAVSFFKAGADSANGFKEKMKLVGRSLNAAFVATENQDRVVKNVGKTFENTSAAAARFTEKIRGSGTATKVAAEEAKKAAEKDLGAINFSQIGADFKSKFAKIFSRDSVAAPAAAAAEGAKTSFIDRIKAILPDLSGVFSKIKGLFSSLGENIKGLGFIAGGLFQLTKIAGAVGQAFGKTSLAVGNLAKSSVTTFAGMNNLQKVMTAGTGAALALGAAVGVALVGKLGELVQRGIASAASMEKLQIALKGVFELTKEGAASAFKELANFAAKTPFELEPLLNSTIKLKSAFKDLSLIRIEGILNDIGAAAAAGGLAGESIQRASLAIQQIGAKGRLSAEEMNQFTEALPNVSRTTVFEILAKKLGKTTDEVIRLQEAGKIGAAEGINALLEAARQAPGAATAIEDQAKTFQGALSTVKDNFNILLGISFTPLLNAITKIFSTTEGAFAQVAPLLKSFGELLANTFTTLAPVLQDLLVIGASLTASFLPLVATGVQLVALFLKPFAKGVAVVAALMTSTMIPVFVQISGVIATVSEFVGKLINFVLILGKKAFKALTSTLTGANKGFSQAGGFVKDLSNNLKGLLAPVISFIVERFKDFQNGLAQIFKFAVKIPGVGKAFKAISESFKEAFGPGSAVEGLNLPEGKVNDFKEKILDLDREMQDLINTTAGAPRVFTALSVALVNAFKSGSAEGIAKIKGQLTSAADLIFEPLDPFKAAIESAKSAKDARAQLAGIDGQINDLAQKRKILESDTAGKIREQQDSLEAIAGIERQIRDLAQEREQILFDEQRRQEEFAPTLASLEDRTLSANINLARAKRSVEEAQKAINDAVTAGIPKEQFNVNLAGLSLDQIRIKLAQVRATLAAQKKGAEVDTEGVDTTKTKEQLQEDLLLSQIGVRDAERELVDLGQSRVDLIRDADIAQREFGERVVNLGVRERELNNQKSDAIAEHQNLLRGEVGIQREIKDITQQITDLSSQRAAAALQVRDAELAAAEAAARSRGDASALLSIRQQILQQQINSVDLDKATSAELQKQLTLVQQRVGSLNDVANAQNLLNSGQLVINPFGIPAPAPGATGSSADLLFQAAQLLISAIPGLQQQQDEIDKLMAFFSRGFAEGAIVNGPIHALVGEAGREAILPLTRPGRLQALLANQSVWSPILSAMPAQAHQVVGSPGPTLSMRPQPVSGLSSLRSGPATAMMSRQEKKKDMQVLAELIASALREGGLLEPRTVEVHAPTTIQTPSNPQVNERAIVRRVLAALEGRL